MTPKSSPGKPRLSLLSGLPFQLFAILILPVTVLLLAVAFGSQTLHHAAMRSLVGDRDLLAVRAAAASLSQEVTHRGDTLKLVAQQLQGQPPQAVLDRSSQSLRIFDGGVVVLTPAGEVAASLGLQDGWTENPPETLQRFIDEAVETGQAVYSRPVTFSGEPDLLVFVKIGLADGGMLLGAFNPAVMLAEGLRMSGGSGQQVWLVAAENVAVENESASGHLILYQAGVLEGDAHIEGHPGIDSALSGESGINYTGAHDGEHVVAFAPITPVVWALVIEESWQAIAGPELLFTQSAPLVLAPLVVFALLAIVFGIRQIVRPIQVLESRAGDLAHGNFESIRQPVGGIQEVQSLQGALADTAVQLAAAQDNLRAYIGALTEGVEQERRTLARELHDDTLQTLIALNQQVQLALMKSPDGAEKQALRQMQRQVDETIQNLRRTVRGLRPIYIEDLGLATALEMLVAETRPADGPAVQFEQHGAEKRLDPEAEMAFYRMAQEALSNIYRHAQAQHAWVVLDFKDGWVEMTVRDDGRGFANPDPTAFGRAGHYGLLGLHERAEMIGAELKITAQPGQGTEIRVGYSGPEIQDHPQIQDLA